MERILDHSPIAKPVDLNMKHGSGCLISFIGLCSALSCHSPVLGYPTLLYIKPYVPTRGIQVKLSQTKSCEC